MSRRLTYVTEWRLAATIEHVWDALVDVESWPRWWPYVREVQTLHRGATNDLGTCLLYTSPSPRD